MTQATSHRGADDKTIADARVFWEARTDAAVSEQDACEAVRNTAAFFDLLARWEGDERPLGPVGEPEDDEHRCGLSPDAGAERGGVP